MPRTIPERYVWAVDILDIAPSDEILEIGCGYGHSIPLICKNLSSGQLTAIDRSERMVVAATRSNQEFIASNKARIFHQDLLDGDLAASHFDKVFLFNINAFWMDPVAELTEIRRLLKPTGRFFLFHQPPPGHDLGEFEAAFRTNLEKYEFTVVEHFEDRRRAVRSLAVSATPNPR